MSEWIWLFLGLMCICASGLLAFWGQMIKDRIKREGVDHE